MTPNVIVRRLLAAGSEMAHAPEAEYVVINENFERALGRTAMPRRGDAPALRIAIRAPHAAFRGTAAFTRQHAVVHKVRTS